jgi:CelD/BcsL family acetyltransferase involved in cellulose biosynthesis
MSTIDIICDVSEFETLCPEWERLLERTDDLTPFQLPRWQFTWWKHFGSGQLRVFAFREGSRLVGVVPCFLHDWNGRRQLTLIGSGISDYLEPAVDREHAAAVVAGLGQTLESYTDWEVCDWQDLNAGSVLIGLRGSGFEVRTTEDTMCSRIALAGTFDEFWSARGKDLRRNVRRYGLRAREDGAVEFESVDRPDAKLLHSLIELHAGRWQAQGQPGMIALNHAAAFLCDITRRFGEIGMLRIYVVRFGGEPAAVNLGYVFRGTYFSYMSAFDPQHEYFGFGRMLLYRAIQHCYANRVRFWNFLRGDEPYKFSWGAEAIPKRRVHIERRAC